MYLTENNFRSRGRRRVDYRTWRQRRAREINGWDHILQAMASAYIGWKYREHRTRIDPSSDPAYNYHIVVLEIFTMETAVTISRSEDSTSAAVDLAGHGFLGKTPYRPDVAIGFRTLELFHEMRLRHPSTSIESSTKVLCDYYQVSSSLRTIMKTAKCHRRFRSDDICERSLQKHTKSLFVSSVLFRNAFCGRLAGTGQIGEC